MLIREISLECSLILLIVPIVIHHALFRHAVLIILYYHVNLLDYSVDGVFILYV